MMSLRWLFVDDRTVPANFRWCFSVSSEGKLIRVVPGRRVEDGNVTSKLSAAANTRERCSSVGVLLSIGIRRVPAKCAEPWFGMD